MTSKQGRLPSDEKSVVNVEPILKHLGHSDRNQIIQLVLNAFGTILYVIPVMDFVFVGYKPDYQCRHLDNVTQVEDYLPDDVTNFTLHDVRYKQCSIDVTVNSSGTSSTHSLPCVAGVNFSMPSHTSFLTEWSLVCDKAGLAELTQTGLFAGQLAGRLLGSVLADRYGRQKVYVTSGLCLTVCLIAMALAPTYYMFVICKIAVGLFAAGLIRSSFTLFVEMLPVQTRHLASVTVSLMWVVGCLFLAGTAYGMQGVSWRYLSLALYSVFLFTLLLPWTLDESIRWLLATGRIKEAEKVLKKACRTNGKDFEKIQDLLHKQPFINNITNNNLHHDHSTDTATGEKEEDLDNKEVAHKDKGKEVKDGAWVLQTKDTIGERNTNEKVINKTKVIDKETSTKVMHEEELQQDCTEVEKEVVDGVSTEVKVSRVVLSDPLNAGSKKDSSMLQEEEVFSAKYTLLDIFRYRIMFVPFLVTVFVWITNNLYYYGVILGSAQLSGNRFLNFSLLTLMDIPSTFVALFLMPRFNRRPLSFFYGILAGSLLLASVGLATLGGGEKTTLTLATVAQYLGMFCLEGSSILLLTYHMELYPTSLRAIGTGTAGMVTEFTNMAAPLFLLWGEKTPWAPGLFLGCMTCLASFSIWLLPETRHRKLPDTIEEIQAWRQKDLHVS